MRRPRVMQMRKDKTSQKMMKKLTKGPMEIGGVDTVKIKTGILLEEAK
jgi:hypothetical protein